MARYGDAWDEITRIDYLLDDLARAVERGEIPRESYDAIAPRHLARRAELAAEVEQTRAGWQAAARAAANTPQLGQTPEASGPPARTVSGAPAAPPVASRPREVRWTQVLAYTGAFLVVVAAAIFTVAVWETVSTTAKLAFLGTFTVAFYAAGAWSWRADVRGVAIALLAVGGALLLFDGWIAIDGYGLDGPWPWAVLLLLCSGVYWLTEYRLAGRFFGVIGAATQVGWWWLLGQGLGWTVAPRLAGIAAVAALWALGAQRARGRADFDSLVRVLHIAAPVTAVGAALGILVDIPIGPPRWVDVAAAAVVAIAVTYIADRHGRVWRAAAALAHVPLLVALVAMADANGASWALVAGFAGAALLAGGYGVLRDGWGHVGVSIVAELAAWIVFAQVLEFSGRATLALLAAVASTWLVAARVMGDDREGIVPEAPAARILSMAAGWGLLSTVTVFTAAGGPRLFRIVSAEHDAILALWLFAVWVAVAWFSRYAVAGLLAFAVSVWAAIASSVAWVDPAWDSAAHVLVVIAVAVVWRHVRPLARLVTAEEWMGAATRVVAVGAGAWSIGLMLVTFTTGEWGVVAAFIALALFATADAMSARRGEPLVGVGPALALAAFAALPLLADAPVRDLAGYGIVAAAGAGSLWAAASIALRRHAAVAAGFSAVPAAMAATVAPLTLFAEPPLLAAAFALAACAWAACAVAARGSWYVLGAGLAAAAAVASVIAWTEPATIVTLGALTLSSALMVVPTIRPRAGIAAPLAAASVIVACATAVLGVASGMTIVPGDSWAYLGQWEAAAAMTWLGVVLVMVSAPYRIEAAEYLGGAAVLMAAWLALEAAEVSVLAPFAALAGVYVAGMAVRWSRAAPGRAIRPITDWVATIAFVGVPVAAALGARTPADVWVNALWAVGLSLVAMAVGTVGRVRAYLFGGVAGLVAVSVWRSFFVLVEFWWVVLGLIGVAMLVIALTWERQQLLLRRTGSRIQELLGGWR